MANSGDTDRSNGPGLRRELAAIYVVSGITLSGVQLILPALPQIRDALGFSQAQIGLVTLVYLMSSFVFGIPAGMLADVIGRRRLTIAALVVFGLSGVWAGVATTMTSFLVARVVQGACFGAVQPTTIALVADAVAGRQQLKGQAHRYVGVATGDAVLPLVGAAALIAAGWRSVFLVQIITLGVALWVARVVPERTSAGVSSAKGYIGKFGSSLRSKPVLLLSAAGVARFATKFGFLTYLPILTSDLGDNGTVAAFVLAAGSAGGALAGTLLARTVQRVRPSLILRSAVGAAGVSVIAVAGSPGLVLMAGMAVLYGVSDGVVGVFSNAFLPAVTGTAERSGVIAAVGTTRNLGKAIGPGIVGVALLLMDLRWSLVLLGILAIGFVFILAPLAQQDRLVMDG